MFDCGALSGCVASLPGLTITLPKRFEQGDTKACDISFVAGYQRQAVNHGGRRVQAVDDLDGSDGAEALPLVRYGVVASEHAIGEAGLQVRPGPAR